MLVSWIVVINYTIVYEHRRQYRSTYIVSAFIVDATYFLTSLRLSKCYRTREKYYSYAEKYAIGNFESDLDRTHH